MAQAWLIHSCLGLTLRQREAMAARRAVKALSLVRKRRAGYDHAARMRGLRCFRQQCRHVADYHWHKYNTTANPHDRRQHGKLFVRAARAST